MWFLWSLLAAFLESGRDTAGKKSAMASDEYLTAFGMKLVTALCLLPLVFSDSLPSLLPSFWKGAAIAFFTVPVSQILYMRAVRLSPLSRVIPILGLNPILIALLSALFDHRLPTMTGWGGIVLIVAGIWISWYEPLEPHEDLYAPVRRLIREPGFSSMFMVCLIYSVQAHASKMLAIGSSALFAALSISLIGSVTICAVLLIREGRALYPKLLALPGWTLLLGLFNTGSELAIFQALWSGYTPYVVTVKRTSIVWSSINGRLFFAEKIPAQKALGICVELTGLVLLACSA